METKKISYDQFSKWQEKTIWSFKEETTLDFFSTGQKTAI